MEDRRISTSFMVRWGRWGRWGRWKYIYHVNGGREQLFDLEQDPDELHNVARDRSDLRQDAREKLTHHLRSENLTMYLDDGAPLKLPFQSEFREVVIEPSDPLNDDAKGP